MRREQDLRSERGGPMGYEVLGPLDVGGFGDVVRARQVATDREVALKRVRRPDGPASHDGEHLQREIRRCAGLVHPNIVPLLDAGTIDGAAWAAFALVPGETLRSTLDREGPLSVPESLHLLGQVLDALGYAHAQNVVHRDLKPENIMVTTTGLRRNALVLDFGLATSVTDGERGEVVGTPGYAAPEQLRGEAASPRSDLYAWGLVLFECLTGERAVRAGSRHDAVLRQLGPDAVVLPAWLQGQPLGALLRRVTTKTVERRAANAAEVLEELVAITPLGAGGRAPASDRPSTAQRRQLTMVSCRLRAASADAPGIDAEEADLVLHERLAELTTIATRYGGHRTSTLADRALFVFGYPQTRENEARLAARAALEMVGCVEHRTPRLEVRLGVHTGLGLVREIGRGDGTCEPLGACARMAAHLDELATAGEVLVSVDTQRLLRGAVSCEPTDRDDVYRLTRPGAGAGSDTIRVARETPLVGRTPQLDALLDGWANAQRGRSGFALVTGEPGIGKSRLVRELRRRVPANSWMEARCVPESQDSPLRPIADVLATAADGALDALLVRHGLDASDVGPLLSELLGRPADPTHPSPAVSPDRRRELTLQALTTLLMRIATERVLVLVVEDLHWADPTTLELLAQLLAALPAPASGGVDALPRLYLVGTARPSPEGIGAPSPTIDIPLARLDAAEVIRLVGGAVGDARGLPAGVLDAVVARADGIPLFVEEIARVLLEAESTADGADAITVPGTLRDLFTARLDALSRGARETAQMAATLGREFRFELLRAVATTTHDGVLREDLRELTDAGLVHQRTRQRPESFVFKHALVRDAAYEMMPLADRRRAHDGAARVLEELFPDIVLDRPEMLAHHCELAGRTVQAAEQWKRVGDRTMARGAYVESIRHLQRGVRLVEQAPARATLGPLELGLIESLGTAQLSTQGYASPEVEATFARAQAVCDRLGEEVPVRALHGIWGVHISRGNRAAVDEILPRFHRLAEHAPDPVNQLTAHAHTGLAAFLSGDFPAARQALEQAVPWYDSDAYRAFLAEYGYDGGLYAYAYLMWTLWIQGDAVAARRMRDTMLALAQRSRNPYGLAIAYGFSANLAHGLGDVAGALDFSARAIAHATEQKLYLWLGPATCTHGWALVASGAREQGLGELAVGLGLFDVVGLRTTHPYHLALQAEAYLAGDDGDEAGLAAVDTALGMTAIYVDRFYEAELHRLRGELLRRQGDAAGARREFETAMVLATRQGALAFALRAALAMGRLLAAQGEQPAARRLVTDACAPLVPGGDTRDEVEAHAHLAEWSA